MENKDGREENFHSFDDVQGGLSQCAYLTSVLQAAPLCALFIEFFSIIIPMFSLV